MTNERRDFVQALTAFGLLGTTSALGARPATAKGEGAPPALAADRAKLMAEMEARPGIAVPRVDGEFLNLLVHATHAQKVLEIGTYRGYSGLWMGTGLEETGGRLVTVEIDPERVKEARGNFARAGLSDRISVVEGDGHQASRTVEGPFDLVFLDAEKGNEVDYFQAVFPKLRAGGFLVLHNAISNREIMAPYLDMVRTHPQLASVVLSLSMRDGMSVSLRKRT
jgi:predicted O-methyltransferase YrrM